MKTTTKPSVNAAKFFNAAHDQVGYLASRWMDEKDYEDINDYAAPLQKIAKKFKVKIVKMTSRPFGCVFTVDGRTYKLCQTSRQYSYQRIA